MGSSVSTPVRDRKRGKALTGSSRREPAGIGFRVRTGNATAVMLGGPGASPRFLARLYIPLVDMDDDEARQPYHVVAEQDEERGMRLVRKSLKTATANAIRATRGLMDGARNSDYQVRAAVLVVGSDTNPASIRQPHVRAHALEGRLYREALEGAVSQCGLASRILVERDILTAPEEAVGKPRTALEAAFTTFAKEAGRPWRSQEKAAALAAWVALELR